MERTTRPGQFIDEALTVCGPLIDKPDPSEDYGTYERMDAAFSGLHEHMDGQRRNQGRIGYASQNSMSDVSKRLMNLVRLEREQDAAYVMDGMDILADGFRDAVADGALADDANKFEGTIEQENMEARLFVSFWPVVAGKSDAVPEISSWRDFEGNIQAYLYGFLDVVSEMAKAITDELYDGNRTGSLTTEKELTIFDRFLRIADSIVLRLSQERHTPGYIINNGFGHWMAYTKKLRTAEGAVAHVRRDYILRCSFQRMHENTLRQLLAELNLATSA